VASSSSNKGDGCMWLHSERASTIKHLRYEGCECQHRKVALTWVLATSSVDPLRWGSWSAGVLQRGMSDPPPYDAHTHTHAPHHHISVGHVAVSDLSAKNPEPATLCRDATRC
jgi:hypothetical protein